MRKETVIYEYEHCGECSNCDDRRNNEKGHWVWICGKTKRKIPDIWGEIPGWCPLEEKKWATGWE